MWESLLKRELAFGPNILGTVRNTDSSKSSDKDSISSMRKFDSGYAAGDKSDEDFQNNIMGSLLNSPFYGNGNSCVLILKKPSLCLECLISDALKKGIYLCALRTVYTTGYTPTFF